MFTSRKRPTFDVARFSEPLADLGRRSLLGSSAKRAEGVSSWRIQTAPLQEEIEFGDADAVIAELCDLAERCGGWIAIGVWRFLYWDYEEDLVDSAGRALNAAVKAIVSEVGLREPYWIMEPVEVGRHRELYGEDPPGLRGVPRFD